MELQIQKGMSQRKYPFPVRAVKNNVNVFTDDLGSMSWGYKCTYCGPKQFKLNYNNNYCIIIVVIIIIIIVKWVSTIDSSK